MSVANYLIKIFNDVQQQASSQPKYIKILEKYYQEAPKKEFTRGLTRILQAIFFHDTPNRSTYVVKCLEFCSKFCIKVAQNEALQEEGNQSENNVSVDISSHPLIADIITWTLKFHKVTSISARFHSCYFIMLILKNIGYDVHLDNDICDAIQDAMLERLTDIKASIRLQAAKALARLQEPLNPDCPVVKAYLLCFSDPNAAVRREVVQVVALSAATIIKVKERLRDVDSSVRYAAFKRCSEIGPSMFKIVDRHFILQSGFNENQKNVKQLFEEKFLPSWLHIFNKSFVDFLKALRLDADEVDYKTCDHLATNLMQVFLKSTSIDEIFKCLPLNEDKVIPVEKLTNELVLFWSILVKFFRKSDECDEFLEKALPELTQFSHYIESVVKKYSNRVIDEYENLEYRFILQKLFEMVSEYDMSEEVGRKTFYSLCLRLLLNNKFQPKLVNQIVSVAVALNPNIDSFAIDMCQIISDIREPLVVEAPSDEKIRERDFEVAKIRLKINCLEVDKENELKNKDYHKVQIIHNEITERNRELENLQKQFEACSQQVRVAKDDSEVICRCLDILSGLLLLPGIKKMSPALRSCKAEFFDEIPSGEMEVNWRFLQCLTLFALIDEEIAKSSAKGICYPITSYRAQPNYDKESVKTAVSGVTDLFRLYGISLFNDDEEVSSNTTTSIQHGASRRKLYRNEDNEDIRILTDTRITAEFVIDIILDMLDDENEDVRDIAITSVGKLILNEFSVNPQVVSRLILKWYNPLTEQKLQQKIGVLIKFFSERVKGSKEIMEKSVIPIITALANAPKQSPLADVDIDNVLRFLSALTNSEGTNEFGNVHRSLATTLCCKMRAKPNDVCTPYMAKMLTYLNVEPDEGAPTKELLAHAELLLEDVEEKLPNKNIQKFIYKLKNNVTMMTTMLEGNNDATKTNNTNTNMSTIAENAAETAQPSNKRLSNEIISPEGQKNSRATKRLKSQETKTKNTRNGKRKKGTNKNSDRESASSSERDNPAKIRKSTENEHVFKKPQSVPLFNNLNSPEKNYEQHILIQAEEDNLVERNAQIVSNKENQVDASKIQMIDKSDKLTTKSDKGSKKGSSKAEKTSEKAPSKDGKTSEPEKMEKPPEKNKVELRMTRNNSKTRPVSAIPSAVTSKPNPIDAKTNKKPTKKEDLTKKTMEPKTPIPSKTPSSETSSKNTPSSNSERVSTRSSSSTSSSRKSVSTPPVRRSNSVAKSLFSKSTSPKSKSRSPKVPVSKVTRSSASPRVMRRNLPSPVIRVSTRGSTSSPLSSPKQAQSTKNTSDNENTPLKTQTASKNTRKNGKTSGAATPRRVLRPTLDTNVNTSPPSRAKEVMLRVNLTPLSPRTLRSKGRTSLIIGKRHAQFPLNNHIKEKRTRPNGSAKTPVKNVPAQQTKRRKKSTPSKMPNLDTTAESDDTILHTIYEKSVQQERLEDDDDVSIFNDSSKSSTSSKKENLQIESPSSSSSRNTRSTKNTADSTRPNSKTRPVKTKNKPLQKKAINNGGRNVVVSETSDSDASPMRKSLRGLKPKSFVDFV